PPSPSVLPEPLPDPAELPPVPSVVPLEPLPAVEPPSPSVLPEPLPEPEELPPVPSVVPLELPPVLEPPMPAVELVCAIATNDVPISKPAASSAIRLLSRIRTLLQKPVGKDLLAA